MNSQVVQFIIKILCYDQETEFIIANQSTFYITNLYVRIFNKNGKITNNLFDNKHFKHLVFQIKQLVLTPMNKNNLFSFQF